MSVLPARLEKVGLVLRGRTLLSGVSLELAAEGRTLVLGPNGAGKSLLLRIVHGLQVPTSGRVQWNGADPAQIRRAQAMVFQSPVLLRRSVAANVRYALAVRGLRRSERRRICDRVLEQTGLSDRAAQNARTLSGGERHRLAIARAWAVAPELLLLDEPTSDLDPAAVATVERLIRDISAAGTKIVMTTQDMAQARRLADDVVFLHRGTCVEHTPALDFFARPASPEARSFLAGDLLI